MSSLAGALDDTKPSTSHLLPKREEHPTYPRVAEQDVEMDSIPHGQAKPQEEDEEMDDLFGNDDVEEAKQDQWVIVFLILSFPP